MAGGKHKHKRDRQLVQGDEDEEEVEEEVQMEDSPIPRLTLKLGQEDYAYAPSLDDSLSYSASDTIPPESPVPRVVIKPFSSTSDFTYPETASFAPELAQQPFPATTDYAALPLGADEDGKIWICPACNKPDDGSPMIGCDGCDEWYHWPCVGIVTQPPDDVEWFCAACVKKDKKKKKKRKKEKR